MAQRVPNGADNPTDGNYFEGLCGYSTDFTLRDSIVPKKMTSSSDPAAWQNVRQRL